MKHWRIFLFLLPSLCLAEQKVEHQDEKKLTSVSLQLMWKHQFEFAGFYAAIEQGYYRDIGLDVRINEFQLGTDVVDEVVSGRAQYGTHDSSLIVDRADNQPVVLLRNIFQHSPMVLISRAGSGITSPAHMVGKKVMLPTHELDNASILSMLAHESVTLDQLDLVEHSFSVDDFVNGKVDVMSAYATNELGVLKQMGVAVNVIHPLNYGIDFYGSNIFTSEEEINRHPQRVKQFTEASLKGWAYALENPAKVIDLILNQYSQRKSREALEFEAAEVKKVILPEHIVLGSVDLQRMQRILDSYRNQGLLIDDFSLDEYVYQGFDEQDPRLDFSDKELAWIRDHPSVTLGIDPNWSPFEFLDDNKEYSGMAADYMRLIEKKTGLKIVVQENATWNDVISSAKDRRLDILPAVMKSPQRDEFLDFTSPHIVYPMVILTDRDAQFISDLEDLSDKRVAVVDGYVTEELLRENHPYLEIVVAEDIDAAIEMVASGEVYAFVDNIATISRVVAQKGYTNLRISGTTQYLFELSIGVPKGNRILLGILQKTLDSISEKEKSDILKRWVSVTYAKDIDYSLVLQISIFALAIFVLILIWNRRLSQEVSHRKSAEEKAYQSEQRFRMLFEDNKAIELIVDPEDGQIIKANHAAVEFYGYSHEHICSLKISDINTLTNAEILEEMANAKSELRSHFYFQHRLMSGEVRDVEVHAGPVQWDGKEVLYSIIHDVTLEKKLQNELAEKTERLSYQASHDSLTGLVNRREFEQRLERALVYCDSQKGACYCTLIFMDLDQFKIVNDTAGHAAGDEVLRKIGKLLQAKVRERDTLARVGGDEFALLLQNCPVDDAVGIALSIIQAIKEFQFIWEDLSFRIGISVGITTFNSSSISNDEILNEADAACYAAKKRGRNSYHIFSQDNEELLRRKGEMWWTNEVIRAIEEDRLVLYRQDIVPLQEKGDSGQHYEILVRMNDQDGKLVLPENFMPSAERYKLMPMIDGWVVEHLFNWLEAFPDEMEQLYLCGVNLSGHSIGDESFTQMLLEKLESGVVQPEKLCWEITETAAISNFEEAQAFIAKMKKLGCSFALDDFGSGLSSFNYLKHLDVDYLKIDGSFVKDMLSDPKDELIVESVHRVGSGLKMKTVAEFVESRAILDRLGEIGVNYAQGYYLDKPRPLESTGAP